MKIRQLSAAQLEVLQSVLQDWYTALSNERHNYLRYSERYNPIRVGSRLPYINNSMSYLSSKLQQIYLSLEKKRGRNIPRSDDNSGSNQ